MSAAIQSLIVAQITRTAERARSRAARLVLLTVTLLAVGCDHRVTAEEQAQLADLLADTVQHDAPTVEVPAAPVTPTVCIDPEALERDPLLVHDLEAAVLWLTAEGFEVQAGTAVEAGCTISVTFGEVPEGAMGRALMRKNVILLGEKTWPMAVDKGWTTTIVAHEIWHLITGRWDHEESGPMSPDGDLGHAIEITSTRYSDE